VVKGAFARGGPVTSAILTVLLAAAVAGSTPAQNWRSAGAFQWRGTLGAVIVSREGDPKVILAFRSTIKSGERAELPSSDDLTVWILTTDGDSSPLRVHPLPGTPATPIDWGGPGEEYRGWTFEFQSVGAIAIAFKIGGYCYLLPWFTLSSQSQHDTGRPCEPGRPTLTPLR
jgi:hypothetical protein